MSSRTDYLETAEKIMKIGDEIGQKKHLKLIPTSFVGLAGELVVMQKLSERGIKFKPKGAQAGYDMELGNGEGLEVRTSRLKPETTLGKDIQNWGWTLKFKDKEIKYEYVVCVALDQHNVEKSSCYLLTREEAGKAPRITHPRFKKIEKRLWIYKSMEDMRKAQANEPKLVHEWDMEINRNKDKYLLENRIKILSK